MSANATAVAASFKRELLCGFHAFDSEYRTADIFKAALYTQNSSIGAATTAYSATGEVSGTGYTAGGVVVSYANAPSIGANGTSAILTPSANITYSGVTLPNAFDCVLIYNASQGNRAVSSHSFGAQTVTAGTLTLTMPANADGTAMLEID